MSALRLPSQTTAGPLFHMAVPTVQPRAITTQAVPNYTHLGCYPDYASPRILNGPTSTIYRNNPSVCCDWCRSESTAYSWCGVENASECWCGSGRAAAPTVTLSLAACDSPCPVAGEFACGGSWAMNLYSATGVADTTVTTAAAATGLTSTSTSAADRGTHLGGGAIAGVVIGGLVALGAVLAVGLWLGRRLAKRGRDNTVISQAPDAQGPSHMVPLHQKPSRQEPGYWTAEHHEVHELRPQNRFEMSVVREAAELHVD